MNKPLNIHQQNLIIRLFDDSYRQSLAEKAIMGMLTSDEIEELCGLIFNEFMLNGITENFEPNDYGKKLEDLLDAVNKSRVQ